MSDDRQTPHAEPGPGSSPTNLYAPDTSAPTVGAADALATVIERDIVPRLLVTHRPRASQTRIEPALVAFTARHETSFTKAVLDEPLDTARGMIDDFLLDGATGEQVLLQLLAPVARRLGVLWETDAIDLVDVTVAVQKMQMLVRHVSDREGDPELHALRQRRHDDQPKRATVLLLPAPSEDHAFGLMILSDVLKRRGMDVHGGIPLPRKQMLAMVKDRAFDVIGFSVSCERHVPDLTRFIGKVRSTTSRFGTKIFVGGQMHALDPNLAQRVGADLSFGDAIAAADHIELHMAADTPPPH